DGDGRNLATIAERRLAGGVDGLDIYKDIGRIRGALEIDEGDRAHRLGADHHLVELFARRAGGEVDVLHAKLRQDLVDDRLARRVERPGVDDDVARAHQSEEQDGDGGHAAGKGQRVLGVFPD